MYVYKYSVIYIFIVYDGGVLVLCVTRKMVPITGRANSVLEKKKFLISNLKEIHSFFALFSSSVSRANLSCVVATIFSSLAFVAFLSTSVSMANLSCLLVTTFSRYRDTVHSI